MQVYSNYFKCICVGFFLSLNLLLHGGGGLIALYYITGRLHNMQHTLDLDGHYPRLK